MCCNNNNLFEVKCAMFHPMCKTYCRFFTKFCDHQLGCYGCRAMNKSKVTVIKNSSVTLPKHCQTAMIQPISLQMTA